MKHKVSELEGALLDASVAMAEGYPEGWHMRSPSSDWNDGGPIIEREGIIVAPDGGNWLASAGGWIDMGGDGRPGECGWIAGPTPLVAAMRAYVTAALGEEISLDEPK